MDPFSFSLFKKILFRTKQKRQQLFCSFFIKKILFIYKKLFIKNIYKINYGLVK